MDSNSTETSTILVVDDTPVNLDMLFDYLVVAGYKVVVAENGEDALTQTRSIRPDLILLDVMMPGIDGFETCRLLKDQAETKDIPIIFMTALTEITDKVEGFEAGAADYITKPFQLKEILIRINTQLTICNLQENLRTQNIQLQQEIVERKRAEKAIQLAHDELERRVKERTSELSTANVMLTGEIIERKQAQEALQLQTKRLDILHQIDQAILAAQSPEEIIDGTLRLLRRLVDCQRASVALFDMDTREALILLVHLNGDTHLDTGQRLSLDDISNFARLQQGQSHLLEDLATVPNPSTMEQQLLAEGIRSYLMVPLITRDELVGSLNLGARNPKAFSAEHLEISRQVADQLAIAIQNTRLFEETHRQAEELTVLNKIGQAITALLNLSDILELITKYTFQLLKVASVSVVLHDQIQDNLWFATASGRAAEFIQGKRMAWGQGIVGWVIEHGEALLIPDAQQDKRFFSGFDKEGDFTTGSILCVPLLSKGQATGAIEAIDKQGAHFGQVDLQLLKSLATSAAVAIENARLYEQAQQEIAERKQAEKALQKAHDELERRVEDRTFELKQANAQLEYTAGHDTLTNLPNRAWFMNVLNQAIEQGKQKPDYLFAVLFIDLDRFKLVNDSLGHQVGDQLLITVARRLEECTRPKDMVARLGGDEFVILLGDIRDISQAQSVADRIQTELTRPINLNGHQIFTTASIGITTGIRNYKHPEDVLRDADTAMYQAKGDGKARYELFDTGQHTRAIIRLRLETDLWRALQRQQFVIYYQPIVSLVTGRISGVEALLRWQHPQRGLIPPSEFIPLAEETGLIVSIGEWLLHTACTQIKAWHKAGYDFLRLAVNISARQFYQQNLPVLIKTVLQSTELSAHKLELEITESIALKDDDVSLIALNKLRAMGIRIAIDDFGLGSSLNNLKFLPLDTLKIDQTFVRGMTTDLASINRGNDAAIITAIITMAHRLNLKVIAEGVETKEHLNFLRGQLCDEIQGFLFSEPMPAEFVTEWLQTKHALAPGFTDIEFDQLPQIDTMHQRKNAYILVNKALTIVSSNAAIERWAVGIFDNLAGRLLVDVFPELVGIENTLHQLVRNQGETYTLSKIYRPVDNDFGVYFDLHIEPFFASEASLIIILTDVTKEVHLEFELRHNRNQVDLNTIKQKKLYKKHNI